MSQNRYDKKTCWRIFAGGGELCWAWLFSLPNLQQKAIDRHARWFYPKVCLQGSRGDIIAHRKKNPKVFLHPPATKYLILLEASVISLDFLRIRGIWNRVIFFVRWVGKIRLRIFFSVLMSMSMKGSTWKNGPTILNGSVNRKTHFYNRVSFSSERFQDLSPKIIWTWPSHLLQGSV